MIVRVWFVLFVLPMRKKIRFLPASITKVHLYGYHFWLLLNSNYFDALRIPHNRLCDIRYVFVKFWNACRISSTTVNNRIQNAVAARKLYSIRIFTFDIRYTVQIKMATSVTERNTSSGFKPKIASSKVDLVFRSPSPKIKIKNFYKVFIYTFYYCSSISIL